jgi:hypothetical protein
VEYERDPTQIQFISPIGRQIAATVSSIQIINGANMQIFGTLYVAYDGFPTTTGTVRHDIIQNGTIVATANLPVTVNFVDCPGRIDTIRVLGVYSEQTRRQLAEERTSIRDIITRSEERYMPRVFANSGVNNVVVKFTNSDGELVTEVTEIPGNMGNDFPTLVSPLFNRHGSRLYNLREQHKADMVCIFNVSGFSNAAIVGPVPLLNSSTFNIDVSTATAKTNPEVVQFSLAPEAIPYTILHEIGHVCGGAHERSAPNSIIGSTPDANGLRYTGQRVVYPTTNTIEAFITGTIMYHGGGSNGPVDPSVERFASERIPYWSNPNITVTVPDQAQTNGVTMPTPRQLVIGVTGETNMTRVMRENAPLWANFYPDAAPYLTLTGPTQAQAANPVRFDAVICSGVPPFLVQWTVQPMLGGVGITPIFSNNNQTALFTMPSGVGAVRVQARVRDASGVESVITRTVLETTVLVVAESKGGAETHSGGGSGEQNMRSAEDELASIQTLFLAQNRPNPCQQETEIAFVLPTAEHVRLSFYDALGREVLVSLSERMNAGIHRITQTFEGLPSGVYRYCLQAGQERVSRTLILVK